MASSVSSTLPDFAYAFNDREPKPDSPAAEKAQPTAAEQMHQLKAAGQSVNEISASLGIPVALVDSDLGITTQPTDTALTTISIKA